EDGKPVMETVTYYVTKDGELTTEETVLKVTDGFTAVEEFDGHELAYDEENKVWYYTDENGERVEVEDEDVQINYTKSFDDLPAGEYTVTETNTAIKGYELQDETSVLTGTATVMAGVASTSTDAPKVELSDEYVKSLGNFELTKTILGDITEDEANGALTFVIKTEDNKYLKADGTLTDNTEEATLHLSDFTIDEEDSTDTSTVYVLRFEGIELGEYTVTEATKDVDGKTVTVEYTVTDADGNEGEKVENIDEAVATVEAGKTTRVDFRDDYTNIPEPKKGNLELVKTIKGVITPEEAAGLLTFVISTKVNEDGTEVTKYLKADKTLTDSADDAVIRLDAFEKAAGVGGTTEYVLKFEDIDLGTYTVTETTADIDGKEYTVTHKLGTEDEATEGPEVSAEVTDGETTRVEFEDDYHYETGSLTIKKSVGGDVTEEEAEGALKFEVKVTFTENGEDVTKWLDKDGKLHDEAVELTIKDGFVTTDGGKTYTKTFAEAVVGDYEVTETNTTIPGYNFISGQSVTTAGTTITKGVEETVEIKDEYEKQAGILELTKTIRGEITEDERNGALTFIVKAENGKYLNKNGGLVENEEDATLTLADFNYDETTDTYTLIIENVDLGNYTVTETTKDVEGKDHTVKYSVNGADAVDGNETQAEIEDKQTTTVAFEDDFVQQTGDFTITKSVGGDVTREEAEGALTFTVTTTVKEDGENVTKWLKADGSFSDTEVILTILNDGFTTTDGGKTYTKTFENVPVGKYAVQEVNNTIPGYNFLSEQSVTEADATVTKNEAAGVTLKDEYEKQKGNLKLTKTILGDITQQEAEGALRFTITTKVTEDGEEVTKYLNADGTLSSSPVEITLNQFEHHASENPETPGKEDHEYVLTFEDLEPGDYTVTETTMDVDGKTVTVEYMINNSGERLPGTEVTAAVEDKETTEVVFEDDYTIIPEPEKGNLELVKTIEGAITEEEAEGKLTFVISTEVTEGTGTVKKYLKADGTLTDNAEEAVLTLKDFAHDAGTDEYILKLENIDLGEYTVTETTEDIDGKTYTVEYRVGDSEDMTEAETGTGNTVNAEVANEKTTRVEFKDDYAYETGSLVITKSVGGDVTEEEADGALQFEVIATIMDNGSEITRWLNADGTLSDSQVILTIKEGGFVTADGGKTYTKTFENVPTGEYTVNETNTKIEGYNFIQESSVTTDTTTVTKDTSAGIELVNEYEKKTGSLQLTKTIKGDVTPEEAAGLLTFEVKTTVTENGEEVEKWLGKDGKLSDEKVQLTLERDFDFDEETKKYTLTIENAGIGEYTIIETDKDVDGNDVTVSYKINGGESTTTADATATVEIKDGETTNVEFEDDYDKHTGSIELTKTIKGPVTEEEAKGALTFHISTEVTENGKTVTKYLKADGTLTTKQNEATLTLTAFYHVDGSDSYTLKIENVELGNYTVTETTKDIDGKNVSVTYSVNGGESQTGTSADAAVEKDETTTVAFENSYVNQTGTLQLTKTIKGEVTPEEAAGLLTFEVTTTEGEGENQKTFWLGKDGKLTEEKTPLKLNDDFTFNEETGTYTLIINNVVVGGYTITETDKDAEGNDVTVTYTINGGDSQTGDTAEAEVKNGEITNVDFEDDYKNQTGTLELTKTIKGDITPEEIDGALRFEITTEDGKWVGTDGKLTGEKTELTLADFEKISDQNYKLTINEIAIGNYTVTETTKDVDGKDVTVTYKVN
ncbi:hypothetical protein SAMN04487833_1601, partial [Sarcina sp. DSM 11001]